MDKSLRNILREIEKEPFNPYHYRLAALYLERMGLEETSPLYIQFQYGSGEDSIWSPMIGPFIWIEYYDFPPSIVVGTEGDNIEMAHLNDYDWWFFENISWQGSGRNLSKEEAKKYGIDELLDFENSSLENNSLKEEYRIPFSRFIITRDPR